MAAPNLTLRSVCFVGKIGTDDAGYNPVGAPQPRLTIAAALADLAANYPAASATAPHFVSIEGGTYTTPAFALPPFTFIVGNPDGKADPTSAVIISLTGNVTLGTGWSVNQTAFGGFANITFRQTSAQNIDLTMPAPAAGNPARTLSLRGIRTDTDLLGFEATSTADVLQVNNIIHDGNNGDSVEFSGGAQVINNVQSAAIVTLNDAATVGNACQAFGIYITTTGAGLVCQSTIAAGCSVRLGGCTLRSLSLAETAPGVIAVAADQCSIPLTVVFSGSAVTADLTITGGTWGTNTNGNAPTGMVGEYLSNVKLVGAAVAMTTNVAANVLSVALTAGDWDVQGLVGFSNNGATTVAYQFVAISVASGVMGTLGDGTNCAQAFATATVLSTVADNVVFTPVVRISLAAAGSAFLNAQTGFGVSTSATYGFIRARRVR